MAFDNIYQAATKTPPQTNTPSIQRPPQLQGDERFDAALLAPILSPGRGSMASFVDKQPQVPGSSGRQVATSQEATSQESPVASHVGPEPASVPEPVASLNDPASVELPENGETS